MGRLLGRGHSQLAEGLGNAAMGQLESDSSKERMYVGEDNSFSLSKTKQNKTKQKRLLCFAIDLKMLSDLASK